MRTGMKRLFAAFAAGMLLFSTAFAQEDQELTEEDLCAQWDLEADETENVVLDENGEPDSVGYDQIPQPDGTIRFYFEFAGREGGIERAESYDVILSIANWEVTPEGEWLREDPDNTWLKDEWVVTVTPEMKGEAQ